MNLPVALQWTKLKDTEVRLLYDTRTNRIVFLIGNAAPQQKRSSQYSHPHLKGNKWQCDITPCLKGTTSMGVATWVWQILQYNECISCRVNKNAPQTSLSPFLVVTVILEDLSEWWRHPSSSFIHVTRMTLWMHLAVYRSVYHWWLASGLHLKESYIEFTNKLGSQFVKNHNLKKTVNW